MMGSHPTMRALTTEESDFAAEHRGLVHRNGKWYRLKGWGEADDWDVYPLVKVPDDHADAILSVCVPHRLRSIMDEIRDERRRQDEKWGEQNHNADRWMVILMEEVGEACQAALNSNAAAYRQEMVQVAAVALASIECLIRNGSMD